MKIFKFQELPCTRFPDTIGANHSRIAIEAKRLPVAHSRNPDTPIHEHLAYLLAQANREVNRQLEASLAKEGVAVEQWRILKILSDGNGRSMSELADAVLVNHPTLTRIVDRMVSSGVVYRVQDRYDRRKVLMFLSDRGRTLCQRLNKLAMSQEAHIVESYGNKSAKELKRLLESLIDAGRTTAGE